MNPFRAIDKKIITYLSKLRFKEKIRLLFVLCIVVPVVLMDVIILVIVYKGKEDDMEAELRETAYAAEYAFEKHLEYPATIADNIIKSKMMVDFLNTRYEGPYDYYESWYEMQKGLLFDANMGIGGAKVNIYADNPTILNGSGYYRMEMVEEERWLRELYRGKESKKLVFDYDRGNGGILDKKRRILILARLSRGAYNGCRKALCLELDFSDFEDVLRNLDIQDQVYVCDENRLIFTNRNNLGETEPFETAPVFNDDVFHQDFALYGHRLTMYVLPGESGAGAALSQNAVIILIMMILNFAMLALMTFLLNSSMVDRIRHMEGSFGIVRDGMLQPIEDIGGNDEIASLIDNYNVMADHMNELVNTVYKGKMQAQEMDIAKQNAELLALHSQINPHFLFNVLESIRMHSLLKGEKETAEMVGRLAVMERTYVNWGDDEIPVNKEMEFVDAYLNLQKYRFGERLTYRVSVEDNCGDFLIPKLTIVTFVENACEHAIEKKAAKGFIFVRVYQEKEMLHIEVEDTGMGMDEEKLAEMMRQVENVSIDQLREKKHIGIMNAFLRLKMVTHGEAEIEIDSEVGLGTIIRIGIPVGKTNKELVL